MKKLFSAAVIALVISGFAAADEKDSAECERIRDQVEVVRKKIDKAASDLSKCDTRECIEKHRTTLLKLSEREDNLMKKFEKECL